MKNLIACLLVALTIVGCSKESIGLDSIGNASGNSKSGSTASMLTYGDYLYIIDNNRLRTLSLADPAHPAEVSNVEIPGTAETIFAYEQSLFIGTRTGVLIYDLKDASKPAYSGNSFHWPARDPVVVRGTIAYSTTRWGEEEKGGSGLLSILDVSNKSNPWTLESLDQPYPYGLGISGDYLYVCNGREGILVYSIIANGRLEFERNVPAEGVYDCIPSEELLVCQMKDGIAIYDITHGDKPVLIRKINN